MSIYRVEVVELDEAGEMVAAVVASLTAERDTLAKFAPGVVAQVLGATTASVTVEATYAADDETTGEGGSNTAPDEADKPKRTRRTKAQMAADVAAARLADMTPAPVTGHLQPPAAEVAMPTPQEVPPSNGVAAAPAAYNPFA